MDLDREKLFQQFKDNLVFIDDVNLYRATTIAIYLIVVKKAHLSECIRNIANKYKVNSAKLSLYIHEAIPTWFFEARKKAHIKKFTATIYKHDKVEQSASLDIDNKISSLRGLLNKGGTQ